VPKDVCNIGSSSSSSSSNKHSSSSMAESHACQAGRVVYLVTADTLSFIAVQCTA
jgi:hypothetical protein